MGSPLFRVGVVIGLAQGLNTRSRLAMSYVKLFTVLQVVWKNVEIQTLDRVDAICNV